MKFSAFIAAAVLAFSASAIAAPAKATHGKPAAKASHAAHAAKATKTSAKGSAKSAKAAKAAGKNSKPGKASKASRKQEAKGRKGGSKTARRAAASGHEVKIAKALPAEQLELATSLSTTTEETGASTEADQLIARAETAAAEHGEVPYASAMNDEPVNDGKARERIYDGLLPGDGYTITMDSFPDENGSTECVQLIKSLLNAPRTIFWKEGRKLQEEFANIRPGTAIATFVKGQYPQTGRTGMHAAIFVRATKAGIYVLDQFRGRLEVTERFIPWHHPFNRKRSNNAADYSTIRW